MERKRISQFGRIEKNRENFLISAEQIIEHPIVCYLVDRKIFTYIYTNSVYQEENRNERYKYSSNI